MSEVLEAKPPTVRMTMLTPLHQELLQRWKEASGPRGTARPSSKNNMEKTAENHGLLLVVGFTTLVYSVHIEDLRVMFKYVQPCPCHSY